MIIKIKVQFCWVTSKESRLPFGSLLFSSPPSHNLPAGDLFAGVPGGLGGKIVGRSVEDHASPHDVADREPIGDEGTEGVSVDAEQRRHIPGVVGMGTAKGIVVHAYVGEGVLFIAGAGTTLVDVKSKNGALAGILRGGQADHLGDDQHAAAVFIKADSSLHMGIGTAATQVGPRGGISHFPSAMDGKNLIWIHKTPRFVVHSLSVYAEMVNRCGFCRPVLLYMEFCAIMCTER